MAKVPRVGEEGNSKQPWSGCIQEKFEFMTSMKYVLLQKSSLLGSSEILAVFF